MTTGIQFDEAKHEYTNDGVVYTSVTQIIGASGLYGNAVNYFDERSRDRGKKVHKIVELHLKGILNRDTVDPALAGYFNAWLKFEKDTGFKAGLIECLLYNDTQRIAGRVDLIREDGEAIYDLKTSTTPSPATGIQLAGYEYLYGSPCKRFALHLGAEGKYRPPIEYKDRADRGVFLAACTLYNWKLNNLKGG